MSENPEPQLSLAEEMAAVAAEMGHESADPGAALPNADEPAGASDEVSSHGNEDAQATAGPEVTEVVDQSVRPGDEEASESLVPPQHWNKADKERFSTLPEEHQQWWLDRAKSLENQHNTKLFELDNDKREAAKLLKAIEPFQQQLQARGMSPDQAIGQLVARWEQLNSDPASTLTDLARQYASSIDSGQRRAFVNNVMNAVGVPIDALDDGLAEESQPADPATAALQQEIRELKQSVQALAGGFEQSQQRTVDQEIAVFKQSNEHYDALEPTMTGLIKGGLVQGATPSAQLADAYAKALAMTPDLQPKPAEPPKPTGRRKVTSIPATTPTPGSNGANPPPAKLKDAIQDVFLEMGGSLS